MSRRCARGSRRSSAARATGPRSVRVRDQRQRPHALHESSPRPLTPRSWAAFLDRLVGHCDHKVLPPPVRPLRAPPPQGPRPGWSITRAASSRTLCRRTRRRPNPDDLVNAHLERNLPMHSRARDQAHIAGQQHAHSWLLRPRLAIPPSQPDTMPIWVEPVSSQLERSTRVSHSVRRARRSSGCSWGRACPASSTTESEACG